MLGKIRKICLNYINSKNQLIQTNKIDWLKFTLAEVITSFSVIAIMLFLFYVVELNFKFSVSFMSMIYFTLLLFIMTTSILFYLAQKAFNNKKYQTTTLKQLVTRVVTIIILFLAMLLYCLWMSSQGFSYNQLMTNFTQFNQPVMFSFFAICTILTIIIVLCIIHALNLLYKYSDEIRQVVICDSDGICIRPLHESELIIKISQFYPPFKWIKLSLQIILLIMIWLLLALTTKPIIQIISIENIVIILTIFIFVNPYITMITLYIVALRCKMLQFKTAFFKLMKNILLAILILVFITIVVSVFRDLFSGYVYPEMDMNEPFAVFLAPMALLGSFLYVIEILVIIIVGIVYSIKLSSYDLREMEFLYNTIIPQVANRNASCE